MKEARPADNRAELVTAICAGSVAPPRLDREDGWTGRDGRHQLLPGSGGIVLGVHVGDRVSNWVADHLAVGAAVEDAEVKPENPGALHLLSCIGNVVRDEDGLGIGVVAGKRGGLAPGFIGPIFVSVEAPDARLASLSPRARVTVESRGRGLRLISFSDVQVMNLSPEALDAIPIRVRREMLEIDVRATVQSRAVGAGLGQDPWVGDLEIADPAWMPSVIDDLSFGDLIAFESLDAAHGRFFRPGFVSIGLVAHGPSSIPGHGPGITLLMSGPNTELIPSTVDGATLAPFLRHAAEESGARFA